MNLTNLEFIAHAAITIGLLGLLILLIYTGKKNKALEKRMIDIVERYRELERKYRNIEKVEASIESVKGSVEVLSSSYGKQMNDIERRIDICRTSVAGRNELNVLTKAINRLVEVVDNLCDRESMDWVGSDSEAVLEPKKATPEDLTGFSGDAAPAVTENGTDYIPGYHWIFPSETPEYGDDMTVGQLYMVIGRVEGLVHPDGSIETVNGYWNGKELVTYDGDKFSDIYAFIRVPHPSDVMERIVDTVLKG